MFGNFHPMHPLWQNRHRHTVNRKTSLGWWLRLHFWSLSISKKVQIPGTIVAGEANHLWPSKYDHSFNYEI
jgi:hypothetical protein